MSQKVKDPSAYDYTPMMPPALLESYRKAMKGDAESMYQMAEAFRQGTEIPRNPKVAIDWLRLAAEKHHPEAMYNYSYACKGNVIARVEWMRSAAEAGHRVAMYDLALMYAEGTLITQDWSLCEQWMTRSAKKGNRKAKDYLGWMYHNGRAGTVDLVQAMRWYEDAAMHGSTRSALALGEIHTFEREHFDPEKAFFWYRFAAYSGDAEAQTNLGYCYQSGIGTEKDAKEAFKWTQEGARRGDRRAMFVLGNYHRWGYGTRTDDRKAFEWMSRSAEKGYARALDTLGVYYSNGIGTPRDIVRGFECYLRAAEAGDANGCTNAGWELYKGFATGCSFRKAMAYCRKAVEIGNSKAAVDTMAIMYHLGQGVKMNRRKSFELFSKAADLGDFHGMRISANLMMKGVDAPLDVAKARELYMKDAEESDLASLEALMEMDLGDVGKPANPKDAYSVAVNCILKRDFAKAEKKLRPGAKRGDEAHMNLLALMHLKGWIETDRTEMTDMFRKALDKGNYMAGYYLGSILSEEECDRETVFDCFMRGLDAGDERAMWRLGRMMYEGDGTTMNREEGIRWMRSAREFGVAEAGEYLAKEGIE